MKLKKLSANSSGLLLALLMAIYCALVAWFMRGMEQSSNDQPMILNMMLVLLTLVFSAAISGTLVFGYPVYLLIHHDTKRALSVLGFTLLYALLILIIATFIISL
ncbi:MAG: hypothetical protein UT86_C0012G0006 [Candidatus Magasanikbacteria bacterium GW2011_GWC2_40_17]|uniref:Uncharacterized protein n=1 Tax=Candidatus Magasanikbacteria bacterium GW2011_GWA2_42_32 TaxID=1619039 RepID=A0A0G1CVV2_9BACT|nr:MAG: hypothetical protein UT86_C0012G0006 [Candidatus Magasanikbacteria bacterium GW2011_GWC2_40_17]KKS53748.1 MAG: hypothetical protein UV20_C0046G0005 [Candidatus Magasanikbacteria bacterium GW2011_GWA2_42_32]